MDAYEGLSVKAVQTLADDASAAARGPRVTIYAVNCGGEYPIHGALSPLQGPRTPCAWNLKGKAQPGVTGPRGTICAVNWAAFSRDTLVLVQWGDKGEPVPRYLDGKGGVYRAGRDSFTTEGDPYDIENAYSVELAPGREVPWGGVAWPVPEGVEIEVRHANGERSTHVAGDERCLNQVRATVPVVSYRITGNWA